MNASPPTSAPSAASAAAAPALPKATLPGATASSEGGHLANDAPVAALIAKLHAGATLADRVRRMRGRREGQRLRRTKATPTKTTLGEETLADLKRQQPTNDDTVCESGTLSLNLKL